PVENGFRYGPAPPAEPQVEMAAELQDGKGFNVMRQNRPAVLPENELFQPLLEMSVSHCHLLLKKVPLFLEYGIFSHRFEKINYFQYKIN
ncbi:MAG: hypothetical protein KA966_06650, partial [Akkermansia sp.]|nr:hypothetical protein [Akkermansia sp.]